MATGIEMLGQMGTDQSLAGPVQGGNMVVKPNQVPVGGAAMLTKALRGQANKGVGGMYLLPEQKDQTPDFMKMAQMNVKREMANRRNQYPMNYAKNEGGIIPMLPRNLKTRPGADETTLAYITPEEQAVLGLLNPGTPHSGPEQVPTYDSSDYGFGGWEDYTSSGTPGGGDTGGGGNVDAEDEYDEPDPVHEAQTQADINEAIDRMRDTGQYTATPEWSNVPSGDGEEVVVKEEVIKDNQTKQQQEEVNKAEEDLKKAIEKGDNKKISFAQKALDKAKSAFETAKQLVKGKLKFDESEERTRDKKRIKELLEKKEKGKRLLGSEQRELDKLQLKTAPIPGAIKGMMAGAKALGDAFSKPKTEQFYDDNYLNILEEEILPGYGDTRDQQITAFFNEYDDIIPPVQGAAGQSLTGEAALRKRLDEKADIEPGSDLEKRLNPEKYWSEFKGGGTMGDMEELAQVSLQGLKGAEGRRLGAKIMEAREISSRQRDAEDRRTGQGRRPGAMGGGVGPVIEDEVIEGVVEEGATTMPYTGPRTGGAAVNVPLSRRFALDPTQEVAQYKTAPRSAEDIYKYYTEGTEGEGRMLEPYGEFQKRRRKALGKEPLDFYSY